MDRQIVIVALVALISTSSVRAVSIDPEIKSTIDKAVKGEGESTWSCRCRLVEVR